MDTDTIISFLRDYYRGPQKQRVGQAFVNRFFDGPHSPLLALLFYEPDPGRALKVIFTEFT